MLKFFVKNEPTPVGRSTHDDGPPPLENAYDEEKNNDDAVENDSDDDDELAAIFKSAMEFKRIKKDDDGDDSGDDGGGGGWRKKKKKLTMQMRQSITFLSWLEVGLGLRPRMLTNEMHQIDDPPEPHNTQNLTRWDQEFMSGLHPRVRFAVSYSLFLLQNKQCYTRLRLYHIMQWKQLSICFIDIVKRVINNRSSKRLMAQVVDAWHRQARIGSDDSPQEANNRIHLRTDSTSSRPVDQMLDLIRGACGNYKLDLVEAEMYENLAAACIDKRRSTKETLERLHSKQHSRVELAKFIGDMYAARKCDPTWLIGFLTTGCACVE